MVWRREEEGERRGGERGEGRGERGEGRGERGEERRGGMKRADECLLNVCALGRLCIKSIPAIL